MIKDRNKTRNSQVLSSRHFNDAASDFLMNRLSSLGTIGCGSAEFVDDWFLALSHTITPHKHRSNNCYGKAFFIHVIYIYDQ
jgi:hypothetical protein